MTDREIMQMALDALNNFDKGNHGMRWQVPVIKALRARLAQHEPWVKTYSGGKPNYTEPCERCGEVNPAEIHTCTPKQREMNKDEYIKFLESACRDIYEVWAGSEGIPMPETAPEGYLLFLVEQMRDIAKRALAQPEQEPVAWISNSSARMIHWSGDAPAYGEDWKPLYTAPPQLDVPETAFGKMPETINMKNFVGSGKPLVPVCWMNANDIDKTDWKVWAHGKPTVSMPLFTVPPQREWVGLTLDEIYDSTHGFTRIQKDDWVATDTDIAEFAHIIEARLKAKNT